MPFESTGKEYKFFPRYMDQLFAPPNYNQDTVSMSSIRLYGSHDLKMWNNEVIQHFVYLRKIANVQNITKLQKQTKKYKTQHADK